MFTGIVEEVGRLVRVETGAQNATVTVGAGAVLEGAQVGDSILTAGVCLTVTNLRRDRFSADVQPETLRRTTLGEKAPGSPVNLERSLTLRSRLGGHFVAGHVDGVGSVKRLEPVGNAIVVTLEAPKEVTQASVDQGSIAVDGVSLTIVKVDGGELKVSLIPHTAAVTTLGRLRPRARVNLEADLIGKYVYAFLTRVGGREPPAAVGRGGLTWEKLGEAGFL